MTSKAILLISGPNLSILGKREPEIYGPLKLDQYLERARNAASQKGYAVEHLETSSEAEIIEKIHSSGQNASAIIINAGALTHYSWSLGDALNSFKGPKIEVHISNPLSREPFRHHSAISWAVNGTISGFGILGYELAVIAVIKLLGNE
jgi:3-dehydroquinate dehydratase-2